MKKQHGGEGKGAYKGNKTDTNLPQHGGEKLGGGKDGRLLRPNSGPGGSLGIR